MKTIIPNYTQNEYLMIQKKSNQKSCLVTGGAGFIGSHLVDRLIEEGYAVKVIDNLSSGRIENLQGHLKNDALTFINCDISDHDAICSHFAEVDTVYHLAALADIVPSIETPLRYHNSNVNGTVSVIEASRKNNVRRFVYAASSSCYGLPDIFPTPEESPIRPMYPYALTKYIGEQYVMHWAQVYKLSCISLRFFNVYGPRARTNGSYGAVFGVFLAQKIKGAPLTIVGDGKQSRDFTYVTDIVDALLTAANSNLSSIVLNVGSGDTYTINELVDRLGGEKLYIPKRPGEPDCTYADITKIKDLLNWQPKVTFAEGVERMLEYIQDWKDAPVWTAESIADATKDWNRYLAR